MKTKISRILLLLVAFTLFYCSEEQIGPRDSGADADADLLTKGSATSARVYSPNVFAIELKTIKLNPSDPFADLVEIDLGGTGGKVAVNWGDGTIEKIILTPEPLRLSHQYKNAKNYVIKIDGEIKKIETFHMAYSYVYLNSLYLSGLTGLKHLRLELIYFYPAVINLSHNKLIETLRLAGAQNLQDLIIPTTNNIRKIDVAGDQLSTQVIDRIIGRVYQSVVTNPRAGSFELSVSLYQESDEMVGPPSGYSLTKLRKLRDTYGWEVFPDFDNN